MGERMVQWFREPAAPLIPWIALTLVLAVGWGLVDSFGVTFVERQRDQLDKEWTAARQALSRHREGQTVKKDLSRVWAMLPNEADFAPLALGISEEAKKDRVTLSALTSQTEPTAVPQVHKGTLQGSVSGRYEDLRRFIYDLETAEEPLYIENLELVRGAGPAHQTPTFHIKIATYLFGEARTAVSQVQTK